MADGLAAMDEAMEVLSNSRRRVVIDVLDTRPADAPPIQKRTLADILASIESADRQSVYVGLHQTHLDKLEDVGAVVVTNRGHSIDRGPRFQQYAQALRMNRVTFTGDRPEEQEVAAADD